MNVDAWIVALAACAVGAVAGSLATRRASRAREQRRLQHLADEAGFKDHAMKELRNAYSLMRAKAMEQRSQLTRSQARVRALEVQLRATETRLRRARKHAQTVSAPLVADEIAEAAFAPTQPLESVG